MPMPNFAVNAMINNLKAEKVIENSSTEEIKTTFSSLSKCHYPISIYNLIQDVFANDDFFSSFRYWTGNQPLEDLPQDEKEISTTFFSFTKEFEESKLTITQPNMDKLKAGIADLDMFSEIFIKKHSAIRCKEGFNDFLFFSFAKYNNPTKFNDLRTIFNSDVAPCIAYEDQKICAPLPVDSDYSLVEKIGNTYWNYKGLVEV